MTTNRLRIALLGLSGAVAGFALQGCFAPQPLPECSVTVTSAALGLTPYYVLLTKVDSSGGGTCGNLKHIDVGMQRFRTQASGGSFTLAVKASPVVDPVLGYTYTANVDDSNDCTNEEDCQGVDDPSASCVNESAGGAYSLNDGTPVVETDAGYEAQPTDGGDPFEVDVENECGVVDEPINRVDPTDDEAKKVVAIGKMAQFPVNGVCAVSDFTGGVQNFQAEELDLVDGTHQTLPAITYKVEFSNFTVITNTKVPGTAFTSDIKLTEGTCVANFKGLGFWPAVHCEKNADCDPNADLDAGRVLGSGINPEFKPTCDTDLGICKPSVDLTSLK